MSFEGKVAIVTGSGHGMGREAAKLLAERGASVVCNDINPTCEAVAEKINSTGGTALPIIADITDANAVKAMINKTVEKFGTIDILINNAYTTFGPRHPRIEDTKEEDWYRTIDICLHGHFHCTRFAVPYMRKKRYGKIVFMGSGAGIAWSRTGKHAYATAKAAIMGLTRQLAKELAPLNINVNCIAPGLIDTYPEERPPFEEMTSEQKIEEQKILDSIPAGRRGQAIELARVMVFLASDDASYIHGQTLNVDGGHWMK